MNKHIGWKHYGPYRQDKPTFGLKQQFKHGKISPPPYKCPNREN